MFVEVIVIVENLKRLKLIKLYPLHFMNTTSTRAGHQKGKRYVVSIGYISNRIRVDDKLLLEISARNY